MGVPTVVHSETDDGVSQSTIDLNEEMRLRAARIESNLVSSSIPLDGSNSFGKLWSNTTSKRLCKMLYMQTAGTSK